MELLASVFVGKPLNILAVAAFWLVLYIFCAGIAKLTITRILLLNFLLWSAYAAWEWLILIKTPEANIRVDLLVLWPALVILTLFTIYRVSINFVKYKSLKNS